MEPSPEPPRACAAPEPETPVFNVPLREPFQLNFEEGETTAIISDSVSLACNDIVVDAAIGLDLRYVQRWTLNTTLLGDLASVISLGPNEEAIFAISRSQRTKLEDKTLESAESVASMESNVMDKEVMNVTRSSAETKQWSVDTSGQISYGGASAGVTARQSETVENRAESTVEDLTETTVKSSEQLKNLKKIEVNRSTESATETLEKRTIRNPYHDRSMSLNVFELYKRYEVVTELDEINPVLMFEVQSIPFTRNFVQNNGDFLNAELLDGELAFNLSDSLAALETPIANTRDEVYQNAKIALEYLFEDPDTPPANLPNLFGGGENERNVSAAFKNVKSLTDMVKEGIGQSVAAANLTYHLYNDVKLDTGMSDEEKGEFYFNLCMALGKIARGELGAIGPESLADAMDTTGGVSAEPARRLPGFVALVDAFVVPLQGAIEEQSTAQNATNRALSVIDRVINHLDCHRTYYSRKYLEYMWEQTNGYDFVDMARSAIESNSLPGLTSEFDFNRGFLDRTLYLIPYRAQQADESEFEFLVRINEEIFDEQLDLDVLSTPRLLSYGVVEEEPALSQSTNLTVPADGVWMEPVVGECKLDLEPPTHWHGGTPAEGRGGPPTEGHGGTPSEGRGETPTEGHEETSTQHEGETHPKPSSQPYGTEGHCWHHVVVNIGDDETDRCCE